MPGGSAPGTRAKGKPKLVEIGGEEGPDGVGTFVLYARDRGHGISPGGSGGGPGDNLQVRPPASSKWHPPPPAWLRGAPRAFCAKGPPLAPGGSAPGTRIKDKPKLVEIGGEEGPDGVGTFVLYARDRGHGTAPGYPSSLRNSVAPQQVSKQVSKLVPGGRSMRGGGRWRGGGGAPLAMADIAKRSYCRSLHHAHALGPIMSLDP